METSPREIGTPCGHSGYSDGHCGNISCWNYFSRCPRHAYSGTKDAECSIDKWMKEDPANLLYEMVQESKQLLMRWNKSGAPRNPKNQQLRNDTKAFLSKSSTRLVMKAHSK